MKHESTVKQLQGRKCGSILKLKWDKEKEQGNNSYYWQIYSCYTSDALEGLCKSS